MALSPLRLKTLHHGRSLSLPSGSHPAISQLIGKALPTVKASEATCLSLASMKNRLNGLKNLYDNIDGLLLLTHNQHIISQESQEKWVDQVLDGYIRLLDACRTAQDLCSHSKHNLQDLLSALRRKDVPGINRYLTSRKKSKKTIQKSLNDLRSFRSKHNFLSMEKDHETMAIVYMLKETESVTVSMLESLLSYMAGTKAQARQSGWSLVSKMMHSKKVSYQSRGMDLNEFEMIDAFLQTSQEEDKEVDELTSLLKEMNSSIQILEEDLH